MKRHSPPPVATWLLGCLLPERDREAVLGDLAEEYALRARSDSAPTVSQWYWRQVCRSVPPIAWSSIRGGGWLRTLGVATGAYIAAGAVEFAGAAAISGLIAPDRVVGAVLGLIVGLTTMALGGYLADRIRPGAATAMAWMVMTSVAVLMVTKSGSVPLWYQLAFLIVGPLASCAGGTLVRTRQA